jgi:hypothetical protein
VLKPDIVVEVGGIDFHHYSQTLQSSSVFFHNAIQSQMKESREKRIVLHGWRVSDWIAVSYFFTPLSHMRAKCRTNNLIHYTNVDLLIPLFDQLRAEEMIKWCDEVYFSKHFLTHMPFFSIYEYKSSVGALPSPPFERFQRDLRSLLDIAEFCMRYSLNLSLERACKELTTILLDSPEIFDGRSLERVVSMCFDHYLCRQLLWGALKKNLPQYLGNDKKFAECPQMSSLTDDHVVHLLTSLFKLSFQQRKETHRKSIECKKRPRTDVAGTCTGQSGEALGL